MFFKKIYHKKDFTKELDSKFGEFNIFSLSKKYLESNAHNPIYCKVFIAIF
jgi:hypothetical protein